MNEMINEVVALRGTEVVEFGQPKLMAKESEFDPLLIDTIDIMQELSQHEMKDYVIYDPEINDEVFYDDAEGYLNFLYDNLLLEELEHHNSFNWNAPVTNHFDYIVYQDGLSERVLIEMKSQLGYGDVRTHYTDSVLLEFENQEEFFYALSEATSKPIEFELAGDKYEAHVDALTDCIEVYDDEGNHLHDYTDYPELEGLKKEVAEVLDINLKKHDKEVEMDM